MKRFLKKSAKVLAWIVGVLAALALVLLAEPKWVLNKTTLVWAVRKFGKDYRPRWDSLAFEIRNVNLLTKRVIFKTEDFCVDQKSGALDACFPLIDLDATLHLGLSPYVSVRRLERLVVHSDKIVVDQTRRKAQAAAKVKKKASSSTDLHLLPPQIRRMTVGLLDVRIPGAVVRTATGTTTASFDAAFTEEGRAPLKADAYVVTPGTAASVRDHYRARVTLATDLWRLGRLTYLDLDARLRGDAGLRADVAAHVKPPEDGKLRLVARATAAVSGMYVGAEIRGQYSADGASGSGRFSITQPRGAVRRFALERCSLSEPAEDWKPQRADLKCRIDVVPGPFGAPPLQEPRHLAGALAAHADFLKGTRFKADLRASIEPQKRFHDFYARLQASLAGRTDKLPSSLKAKHQLELGMKVRRFHDLVAYLEGTELAVPAPVNAFHGPVTLRVRTAGDSRGPDQRVNYSLVSDLSSAKQAFKMTVRGHADVKGLFREDRRVVDRTEVDLEDVMLELPDLQVGRLPSPFVDTRIKTGAAGRDAAAEAHRPKRPEASASTGGPPSPAAEYDVHVFTGKPVRLVSNLVPKQPVPIALDLHARGDGLSGTIKILAFDAEVFHQQGRVDHVTLTAQPGTSDMKLDGKIVYKRQDVTINILLVGSTDKPTVTFESSPPMDRQQIVALLLYGKPPEELDADQKASAGTAAEAFTSGALGLSSLYLFASTPIDSVGYDPATQTYQIRFKLPGGATLSVGSNLRESKTLTLRKRLAPSIELETQVRSKNQRSQQRSAVTTFLEWFRRY